jgi:hypothetical protein
LYIQCVSVNHLHLPVQIFYNYTYPVAVYIFFFILTGGQRKYLSNTLTQACVNDLGCVSANIKIICKVTLSLGLLSPQTLLCGYPLNKEILLNLKMKCWNSAFHAQGSRLIILALQVGAVKIYAATVEALKKEERQGEVQFTLEW